MDAVAVGVPCAVMLGDGIGGFGVTGPQPASKTETITNQKNNFFINPVYFVPYFF